MTWRGRKDRDGNHWVHWESAWYDVGVPSQAWRAGGYEYVSLDGIDCFAAWVRS